MGTTWKFLVTIDNGTVYRLAREHISVEDDLAGYTYSFVPGIIDLATPALGVDSGEVQVTINKEFLDFTAMAGNILNGAAAEVSLWKSGWYWKERIIILKGRVSPAGVSRFFDRVQLTLSDYAEQLDSVFPPWVMTKEGFPNADDNAIGTTIPVVYGHSREVPLRALDKNLPDDSEIKFLLTGHELASASVFIRPSGEDDASFYNFIEYAADPYSGAKYSYVKFSPSAQGIDGVQNLTGEIDGHKNTDGGLVSGLGDVVLHALTHYGNVPIERMDYFRLSKFKTKANRISVSSIFGGSNTETLISTLKNRYENQFNILISWRNGRIGADFLFYDPNDLPVKSFQLNRNVISRIDPVTTSLSEIPYSAFSVSYDMNILLKNNDNNPKYRKTLKKNRYNDERCARAYSFFGEVTREDVELSDIADPLSAGAVFDILIDKFAVPRTRVTYLIHLDDIIEYPLYEKYLITDSDMGWTDEPFRLDEIAINEDDTASCVFTSYNFLP